MAQIIHITDLNAPCLAPYVSLTDAQLRSRQNPDKGIFIAEGVTVIGHALDAGCEALSFLMEEKHASGKAKDLIARCDAPVYAGESDVLSRLTGYPLTRGVLAAMRRPAGRAPADVIRGARRIAVLEDIVDAANLGAIFRSAAALGVDGALLTPGCCDPLCRRAIRVSMGTAFGFPWARLGQEDAPAFLRDAGFVTAAMALSDAAVPIDNELLSRAPKLALFFGAEGDGLKCSTIAACDRTVIIPMSRGVDSLNVAAAAAVAFWQTRIR